MGFSMHMLAALVGGAGAGGGMTASILFYVFAGMAVVGAGAVAIVRDASKAGLGLLLALVGVAGLYFLLHAEFLAAAELLVAAGGTAAMLLMGVGMLGKRETALFGRRMGTGRWVGAALAGGGCAIPLMVLAAVVPWAKGGGTWVSGPRDLGAVLAGGGYLAVGVAMGLGLMTVLVGGAYMARAKRPAEPGGPAVVRTLAPVRKTAAGGKAGGGRR